MISSKELLTTYNVLDTDSKKKHAYHEFQAFAYKLAHDLNDLSNLKIYMRLAKKVERSLMERAYSYALDSKSENKGKKFMWKLKELRNELKERINSNNFDYKFVQKEMKTFREALASVLLAKKNKFNDVYFAQQFSLKNNKVLIINCLNFDLIDKLSRAGYKISAVDLSRKIRKLVEEKFEGLDKKTMPKISCSDFLKNRFKEKSFDYIVFNEAWCTIATDDEIKVLKAAMKLLKSGGSIQLISKQKEEALEWRKYKYKDTEFKYLLKLNSSNMLEKRFKNLGLKISKKIKDDEEVLYLLAC